MGIQKATSKQINNILLSNSGFMANQPISTGLQPAIMPKKTHDTDVLRHTAEATVPTKPKKKQIAFIT